MVTESKLLNYLNISLSDFSNNKKEILVFKNMEYMITYYNPLYGSKQTVTALVEGIWEDKIKIKCAEDKTVQVTGDCSICTNMNCTKRTVEYGSSHITKSSSSSNCGCNCIYNSSNADISKYEDPKVYFIPVSNIMDISYAKNNAVSSNTSTESKEEGEIHVMLLGISATTIKAIVVRLEFFDDNIEEAVRYVDLEVGGIYDLCYDCIHRQTIYESRVKIVKIEECERDDEYHCCCGCNNATEEYYQNCKPGRGFVRENVGFNNSVYIYHDCRNTKDDFMKAPPARKIKITVDTSETFEGRYETIMLDSIRDCRLVCKPDGSEPDYSEIPDTSMCENCHYKTDDCDPCDCIHCLPPKRPRPDRPNKGEGCGCETYEYTYDNKYKATVSGEKVQIYSKGETIDLDLDSLIKFYLGVD